MSLILRLPRGHLFAALIASLAASFRSRTALQLEILALRHQIGVLQRSVKRPKLTPADRLLWAWLYDLAGLEVRGLHHASLYRYRLAPQGLSLVLELEDPTRKIRTAERAHQVRELIRTMSRENPLWGAPRIHGELLKLGIQIGETSVGKYLVSGRRPPSQMVTHFPREPFEIDSVS